ncbi:MAG: glycosyltransferase family 4 protein [Clostridia bacterium]|nr:glycosyltransferase family 4 protein [Clostridia bacterium]
MKILVVCQHYYPEPFRITDICEEWVKRGHEVTVVTGLPNYPMGEIYDGYKNKEKREENINGVTVKRCSLIPRKSGAIFRLLNYYSFAFSSKRYLKKLKDEYDVVFVNQLSPVMMANGALAYKKKHGTKTVLYCLDLWPESLVVGGIKRGSFLYKFFHRESKRIYQGVDEILITSKSFEDYFVKEFSIGREKITYLPQYAEDMFSVEKCKKAPDGKINLLFAGNVGKAQTVDLIVRVAKETEDVPNLCWHIVGDGSELENCKKIAEELGVERIVFHGRKELSEMPSVYARADGMIVTLLADEVLSLTLPGKVQTYMAAGKPIIAAANGEIRRTMEEAECGYCVKAEDVTVFAQAVRDFCKDVESGKSSEYGKNARAYYEKNFKKEVFFSSVEKRF